MNLKVYVEEELTSADRAKLESLVLTEATEYHLRYTNRHLPFLGISVPVVGFEKACVAYTQLCDQEGVLPVETFSATDAESWFSESGSGSSWVTCEKITQVWVSED